jgi:hypothetical protein
MLAVVRRVPVHFLFGSLLGHRAPRGLVAVAVSRAGARGSDQGEAGAENQRQKSPLQSSVRVHEGLLNGRQLSLGRRRPVDFDRPPPVPNPMPVESITLQA